MRPFVVQVAVKMEIRSRTNGPLARWQKAVCSEVCTRSYKKLGTPILGWLQRKQMTSS